MKCEAYQELISPYLDDTLSYDEKLQLEAHLKTCPTCEETLEMMRLMIEGLGSLEEKELPQDFHNTLHAQLQKEQNQVQMSQKVKKSPYRWMAYSTGIAAAVLLAVIVLPNGSNNLPEATTPPQAAPYTRVQAEGYALEPKLALEEESQNENQVDPQLQGAPQMQVSKEAVDAALHTEEEWSIRSNDLEALAAYIQTYCDEEAIELTTWEEENSKHFVLEPHSKEDFKAKLGQQFGSDVVVKESTSTDLVIIHLIANQ